MGLFSKRKMPEIKVPSAEELFQKGLGWAQGAFPEATGAREQAAKYLTSSGFQTPVSVAPTDYSQFQPTSLEQALSSQYFENVWPETAEAVKHGLSLSGMATSPILGRQLGKARGQIGYDIGRYLSELGQRRGEMDLQRRMQEAQMSETARRFNVAQAMGIDPMSMITPYAQTGATQSARQAEADLQNYMNEMQGGMGGTIGSLIGMGAGAIAAPFTGGLSLLPAMSMGGALGGQIGSLFGGQSPIDMGSALQIGQMGQQMGTQNLFNDYLKNIMGTAQPVGGGGEAMGIEQMMQSLPRWGY